MSYLYMDKPALRAVSQENANDPVFILNLLKFRETAEPGYGVDGMSGEEAFHVYSKKFFELNESQDLGGEAIWMGKAGNTLIGGEDWDLFVLARYPNRGQLVDLMGSAEYDAIALYRAAGLADSRMIEADELLDPNAMLAGE